MPEHILHIPNKPSKIEFESEVNSTVNIDVKPKHGYDIDHWEDLDASDPQYRATKRKYIVKSSNNALVVRFRTKDLGSVNVTNVVPVDGSTIIVPETMPFDATFTFDSTKNWAHKIIVNGLDGSDYSLIKHSKYEVVMRFNESARGKLGAASIAFEDLYSNRTSTYNMRPSIKNITISVSVEPVGAPDLNITPGPYTDKTSVTIDWGTKVGYKGLRLLVNDSPVQVPYTATFKNDVTVKGIYEPVLNLDAQDVHGVAYYSTRFPNDQSRNGYIYFGTKQLDKLGRFEIYNGSNKLYPTPEATELEFFKVPIFSSRSQTYKDVELTIVLGGNRYPFIVSTANPPVEGNKYGRIYKHNDGYHLHTNINLSTVQDEHIEYDNVYNIDLFTMDFNYINSIVDGHKPLVVEFNQNEHQLFFSDMPETDTWTASLDFGFDNFDTKASVPLNKSHAYKCALAMNNFGGPSKVHVELKMSEYPDIWGVKAKFDAPKTVSSETFRTSSGYGYYGTEDDVYYSEYRLYAGNGAEWGTGSAYKQDSDGSYIFYGSQSGPYRIPIKTNRDAPEDYVAPHGMWQVKYSKYDDWEDIDLKYETSGKARFYDFKQNHPAYYRIKKQDKWYQPYLDTNTPVPMWRKGNLHAIDLRIFPSDAQFELLNGSSVEPLWKYKMAVVRNADKVLYLEFDNTDPYYDLNVKSASQGDFKITLVHNKTRGSLAAKYTDNANTSKLKNESLSNPVLYLNAPQSTKFTASDITIDFRYESYDSERYEVPTGMNGMTGDVRDDYEIIDYGVGGMRFYGLFHYNSAGIKMLTSQNFYGFNSISLVGKPYDEYSSDSHHYNDLLLSYVVDERSGYKRGYYNNQLKDSHVLIASIDGIQHYTENFDLYYTYHFVVDSTLNQEPFGNKVFGPLDKLNDFNN